MDKLRSIVKTQAVLLAFSLTAGIMIGLLVLGWWLWPVKWVDASPEQLQIEYKRDYLCMAIDSYVRNQDEGLLNLRWKGMGDSGQDVLEMLTPAACHFTSNEEIESFKTLQGISAPVTGSVDEEKSTDGGETDSQFSYSLIVLFCAITLVVGGSFAYFLLKRGKLSSGYAGKMTKGKSAKGSLDNVILSASEDASVDEPPLAQFMTTYRLGDDIYDESFSIDSPTGEFLGECGVGVAETIGVGEPKKVTALEVWLFDKNDIQTITKVLMSEHAFNDQAIRQRLSSKGETIEVKSGQRFIMETATLQLEARVIDIVYGRGPLPENSFLSRLTLEISVWNKIVA
ncbi:MAG TPA: hypothetical protein G4N92_07670 [Anaerolineae bacterium]|nr:hypothetical protein [Anaerolineae bacterium]